MPGYLKNGLWHEHRQPYTVGELHGASRQPPDVYHRELMEWAARRIRAQEKLIVMLREELERRGVQNEAQYRRWEECQDTINDLRERLSHSRQGNW